MVLRGVREMIDVSRIYREKINEIQSRIPVRLPFKGLESAPAQGSVKAPNAPDHFQTSLRQAMEPQGAVMGIDSLGGFSGMESLLESLGGFNSMDSPGAIMDNEKLYRAMLSNVTLSNTIASLRYSNASVNPSADSLRYSNAPVNPSVERGYIENVIDDASRKYDVNPNLIRAVIKAESNFNPNVVSSAGAMGIMQLMPATAEGMGVEDPFDIVQNINAGVKLIRGHLDNYDGDLSLALAAYNAGSGNVRKYGGVPPFTETQNYIVKVNQYFKEYSAG
jgi:hypothetical protein